MRVWRSGRSLSRTLLSPQKEVWKTLAPGFISSSRLNVPPAGGAKHRWPVARFLGFLVFLQQPPLRPPTAVFEPQQNKVMAVTPSYALGWFAAQMLPAEGQSPLRQFCKVFNEGLIMVLNEIPKWEVKQQKRVGATRLWFSAVRPTLTSFLPAWRWNVASVCGRVGSDEYRAWGRLRSLIYRATYQNTGRIILGSVMSRVML